VPIFQPGKRSGPATIISSPSATLRVARARIATRSVAGWGCGPGLRNKAVFSYLDAHAPRDGSPLDAPAATLLFILRQHTRELVFAQLSESNPGLRFALEQRGLNGVFLQLGLEEVLQFSCRRNFGVVFVQTI
jgi:hypothetical protein